MWREIAFIVARDEVERWSDALLEAGALSVQAEDADADTTDEQAIFGEPGMPAPESPGWTRTRLTALMRSDDDHRAVFDAAAAALGAEVPLDVVERTFDDQDWVRLTQSQFKPIPIGRRLLVTPSWRRAEAGDGETAIGETASGEHEAPGEALESANPAAAAGARRDGRIEIILDPGLAFGTGSHPTTRLCMRWLEENVRAGQTVIDYGCGSGILAIAAAKLGAGAVIGIDIDPQALTSSRDNAQINAVTLDIRPTTGPLPEAADIVVANILATPLRLLAPLLQSLVRPGGALVLAGLLERQVEDVAGHYGDIAMTPFAIEDGWACLAGRKAG